MFFFFCLSSPPNCFPQYSLASSWEIYFWLLCRSDWTLFRPILTKDISSSDLLLINGEVTKLVFFKKALIFKQQLTIRKSCRCAPPCPSALEGGRGTDLGRHHQQTLRRTPIQTLKNIFSLLYIDDLPISFLKKKSAYPCGQSSP